MDGWSHLCRSGALGGISNLLIETVDGRVPSGTHSLEQLIVASNEVASATAQLVAASRVKANLMSKMQERLKVAAKVVTEACKALVKLAYDLGEAGRGGGRGLQIYGGSRAQEARLSLREMEQQVEILRLEKDLGVERLWLGVMRRAGYHKDETD